MSKVFRIAKTDVNVLTATDPNDFILHEAYSTFKILAEGSYTNLSVNADPTTFTLAHGMGRIVTAYAFARYSDGGWVSPREIPYSGDLNRYFQLEMDETNVYFTFYKGVSATHLVDLKYYLFEAPVVSGTAYEPEMTGSAIVLTKNGYNALTERDPDNQVFNSKYNTLKYHASGVQTVTTSGTTNQATIAHGLGYAPFFIGAVNLISPGYNFLPGKVANFSGYVDCDMYADATNIFFKVHTDYNSNTFSFAYKIFRNRIDQ